MRGQPNFEFPSPLPPFVISHLMNSISDPVWGQLSLPELWFIFSNYLDEKGICREIRGKYADEYRKNVDFIKNDDVIGKFYKKVKIDIIVLRYG